MNEMSKEMMKAGVLEEMMTEAVDNVLDDVNDEADEEVNKVLFEQTEGRNNVYWLYMDKCVQCMHMLLCMPLAFYLLAPLLSRFQVRWEVSKFRKKCLSRRSRWLLRQKPLQSDSLQVQKTFRLMKCKND